MNWLGKHLESIIVLVLMGFMFLGAYVFVDQRIDAAIELEIKQNIQRHYDKVTAAVLVARTTALAELENRIGFSFEEQDKRLASLELKVGQAVLLGEGLKVVPRTIQAKDELVTVLTVQKYKETDCPDCPKKDTDDKTE